jgi:hypothetical protein
MTKKQYQNATGIFSTQLAIGSFLIGTLLLILQLLFPNGILLEIGLIYVSLAFLMNLIVLINLIILCFTQKNHQEYYTIKILILLANIPIALVYLQIIIENI